VTLPLRDGLASSKQQIRVSGYMLNGKSMPRSNGYVQSQRTVAATPSAVTIPLVSGGTANWHIPHFGRAGPGADRVAVDVHPFTRSNPMSVASLLLLCELFRSGGNGSRTDTLNMEIDLEDLPQLPAGTYARTL
jgi:hypothetical protein